MIPLRVVMVAAAAAALAVVLYSFFFCEHKNKTELSCLEGRRGAAPLWSLLPRLLSAGWGGVGGRWMRRAADTSKQRFIPWKKKRKKKSNCSKASFPYFSDGIRLIHSSLPTDFPLLSPQYSVLTLTQIITLALSLKKKLLSAPSASAAETTHRGRIY